MYEQEDISRSMKIFIKDTMNSGTENYSKWQILHGDFSNWFEHAEEWVTLSLG